MAQFQQTMAGAAAGHLGQPPQFMHPQHQFPPPHPHQILAQPPTAGLPHGFPPQTVLSATQQSVMMAASAIVAGGQQQLVRRFVKWVISGDYIVLRDHPRGGPPPEYYVNLAYVAAPRFNRTPGEDGKTSVSEPFAWEAKEYLAKRLIGQEVIYKSEYTRSGGPQAGAGPSGAFGANSNKEFGLIYFGDENVVETMVREGLLEVRRTKAESPALQQLIEAEEEAKKEKRGKWGQQCPKRELVHEHPNPSSLKGKTFNATIENVRNGGAIQAYLDLGEENGVRQYLNASIMVSGIRSPDKNRANEAKFFEEAKYFTEARLLNREVKVHIEKVDRNSYLATVYLGQNNLAEALLRQGMARCNDVSISLTKAPEKLRAAEKEAKSKRLRIWEQYVDAKADVPAETFEAKVIEVVSGDCLIVDNLSTNEPAKKIFLASIRLGIPVDREKQREAKNQSDDATTDNPKLKENKAGNKGASAGEGPKSSIPRIYDNTILYNARELLRKKLLGKKALIKVEYIQPKSNAYPEKVCCTVRLADQPKWNASEALVTKGYASVLKHYSDDSYRASNFDELLKAEQIAIKNKDVKDKEKNKENAPLKITDICNDANRGKQLLPFLARTRKEAVVEFVFSASKFKLFLAKENNTLLNLVLAGVNVPREPEALKNASTALAKSLVHQRDVSIHIDTMDKKGNFIGWIYYRSETDHKETSLNLQLVKHGYAQVRDSSAAGSLSELKAAEVIAREKKLGLWLTYQEPKKHEQEAVADIQDESEVSTGDAAVPNGVTTKSKEEDALKNRKPVIVSNAQLKEKTVVVSVQHVEAGPKLESLLKRMRAELQQSKGAKEAFVPVRDQIVAAKFSADKQWYRAKVLKYHSPSEIDVVFIDYGNEDKLKLKDLAKLSQEFASEQPFATDYALAFVEAPTHDQDWVEESRLALIDAVNGQVYLRVEYKDPASSLDAVTLVNESNKADIGKKQVEGGLLIAAKRRERKFARTISDYINAENTAKRNRANMWQYGDFTADEAREFGRV